MIWIRSLTMTNLRVIQSTRSRIKMPSEDTRVLYWSACYGLAVAATTLQAGVNILLLNCQTVSFLWIGRIFTPLSQAFNSVKRTEGDQKGDEPSYEAVLKLPLGL